VLRYNSIKACSLHQTSLFSLQHDVGAQASGTSCCSITINTARWPVSVAACTAVSGRAAAQQAQWTAADCEGRGCHRKREGELLLPRGARTAQALRLTLHLRQPMLCGVYGCHCCHLHFDSVMRHSEGRMQPHALNDAGNLWSAAAYQAHLRRSGETDYCCLSDFSSPSGN